jgi:hypothetical protein
VIVIRSFWSCQREMVLFCNVTFQMAKLLEVVASCFRTKCFRKMYVNIMHKYYQVVYIVTYVYHMALRTSGRNFIYWHMHIKTGVFVELYPTSLNECIYGEVSNPWSVFVNSIKNYFNMCWWNWKYAIFSIIYHHNHVYCQREIIKAILMEIIFDEK